MNRKEKRMKKKELNILQEVINVINQYFPELINKLEGLTDLRKVGNRPVYNFVFGNVLGKKAVFLIQNIFPITEKYIAEKYINSNIDVEIPEIVRNEIITIALRVVRLAEEGINVPFYNIIEMKNILLEENHIK